jgi:hypothetical protein
LKPAFHVPQFYGLPHRDSNSHGHTHSEPRFERFHKTCGNGLRCFRREIGPDVREVSLGRYGLSLSDAAEALGLSRRQVAYYASGERPVPRTVLLACKGWEAEKEDAAA